MLPVIFTDDSSPKSEILENLTKLSESGGSLGTSLESSSITPCETDQSSVKTSSPPDPPKKSRPELLASDFYIVEEEDSDPRNRKDTPQTLPIVEGTPISSGSPSPSNEDPDPIITSKWAEAQMEYVYNRMNGVSEKVEAKLRSVLALKSRDVLTPKLEGLQPQETTLLGLIRSQFKMAGPKRVSSLTERILSLEREANLEPKGSLLSTPDVQLDFGEPQFQTTDTLDLSLPTFNSTDQEILVLNKNRTKTQKTLHFSQPPTHAEVMDLVDHVKENPNIPIPVHVLLKILKQTYLLMSKQKNECVRHISPPRDGRINVIGDIHGQLNDCLWMFYKHDYPSPKNFYLFNGDMVDRGTYGVEIIIILFAFYLLSGGRWVFFNRGNHEDINMNERLREMGGGFASEVRDKYKLYDSQLNIAQDIFLFFQNIFDMLPLATVIKHKIFVVHGGLTRMDDHNSIRSISQIINQRPIPIDPYALNEEVSDASDASDLESYASQPTGPKSAATGLYARLEQLFSNLNILKSRSKSKNIPQWMSTVMFDLLWSDPQDENGFGVSTRGERCVRFGPDVTARFCERNNITLVVRSHEVPKDGCGFRFVHNNQLVTIFSASNYVGTAGNKGAVLVVPYNMKYQVFEFFAPPLEKSLQIANLARRASTAVLDALNSQVQQAQLAESENSALSSVQLDMGDRLVEVVIREVALLVLVDRVSLFSDFVMSDENQQGTLSSETFFDTLFTALRVKEASVAKVIRDFLNPEDAKDIRYRELFNRFQVYFEGDPQKMVKNLELLDVVGGIFDAILKSRLGLHDMFSLLDRDWDGNVSYSDFQIFFQSVLSKDGRMSLELYELIINEDLDDQYPLRSVNGRSYKNLRMDGAEFLVRLNNWYRKIRGVQELPLGVIRQLIRLTQRWTKMTGATNFEKLFGNLQERAHVLLQMFLSVDAEVKGFIKRSELKAHFEKLGLLNPQFDEVFNSLVRYKDDCVGIVQFINGFNLGFLFKNDGTLLSPFRQFATHVLVYSSVLKQTFSLLSQEGSEDVDCNQIPRVFNTLGDVEALNFDPAFVKRFVGLFPENSSNDTINTFYFPPVQLVDLKTLILIR